MFYLNFRIDRTRRPHNLEILRGAIDYIKELCSTLGLSLPSIENTNGQDNPNRDRNFGLKGIKNIIC